MVEYVVGYSDRRYLFNRSVGCAYSVGGLQCIDGTIVGGSWVGCWCGDDTIGLMPLSSEEIQTKEG